MDEPIDHPSLAPVAVIDPNRWPRRDLTAISTSNPEVLTSRPAVEPEPELSFAGLVGASPGMRRVFDLAHRLAGVDVPFVIEGETGSGKSALAEAIHGQGRRASGPCIVLDCAAVSPAFVDAALFGYEASESAGVRPGVFEQANGGTLILDQIDLLADEAQSKISRVLEASRVRRLGGVYEVPVDVRIIATSRRDLAAQVHAGLLRPELYYRLALTRVHMPPLRDRVGDIPVLLRSFAQTAQVHAGRELVEVADRFIGHRWPGNVRELSNAFERWMALGIDALMACGGAREPLHEAGELGRTGHDSSQDDIVQRVLELNLSLPRARQQVVAEFERRYVERVLRMHDGSIARAAEASGIARRYFRLLRARIRERNPEA